jgi:DNA ligase-1
MGNTGAAGHTAAHATNVEPIMHPRFLPQRRRLLATLALVPASLPLALFAKARADGMPLPLAVEAPGDTDPAGMLVSEKYDGVRAVWDGEALRFRSGQSIAAPAWFVASLPRLPLDGELWLGRGRFEALSGLVRRAEPQDAGWRALRYMVFDLPSAAGNFSQRYQALLVLAQAAGMQPWQAVEQTELPDRAALQRRLHQVVSAGGEGLVLHRAGATWAAGRHGALLKLKPLHDAEALVVGHVPGQGRHAGRLGALRVRTQAGAEFNLGTGFSDAVRESPPMPGTVVSYRHRGHTDSGLPRFASFLRVREPGL